MARLRWRRGSCRGASDMCLAIPGRIPSVRDDAGQYLGCLETVQDVTGILKLTGQKRLLDEAA